MKKLALAILALHIFLILITNRALFLSKFDQVYWKDKYEQSQWKLPLSQRTLGDDGLYLYEGYRIFHDADPSLLNAEVPPLGKYLIGATVVLFHNGAVYGFLVYVAVLLAFYLLARQLLPAPALLLVTTVFALDPLLTAQSALTMLDGIQLFFLLLFLFFIIRQNAVLAGLALGFFAETKFGILAPLLVIIGLLLLKKNKFIFLITAFVAYLLPYFQYFHLGHSFFDWIKLQKWIVNFYLNNNLSPNFGSELTALLFNRYQNIFSRLPQTINEWSPVWPVITITSIFTLRWKPIVFFLVPTFLLFLVIPFWTRYLLVVLPFLYLGAGKLVIKSKMLFFILFFLNAISAGKMLFPTPEATVKQVIYELERGFFQDIYEDVSKEVKFQMSREYFHKFGLKAYYDAEIENVEITLLPASWSRFEKKQIIPISIRYVTRHLGAFEEKVNLPVVKEDGRWRLSWSWDLLFTDFADGRHLETTVNQGKRGSIIASDKKPISYDFESIMLWIKPEEVDHTKEPEMLKFIQTSMFKEKLAGVAIHQRYVGNTLSDQPRAIGVIPYPLSKEDRQKLLSFPSVILTPAIGRLEGVSTINDIGTVTNSAYGQCCSLLYSTTNYDGFSGIEKEKNNILKGYDGGSLVIKDLQGNIVRTIIEKEKTDGRNVPG